MRISDRRYRWEFQLKDGETSSDFEAIGRLQSLIGPWTGEVPVEDLEIVRVAEYTFRAQLADRWRDRNVFVLGDAAHLTPPFIGQGMGAGLRDAANLSWKLAGVLDGTLPASVLDTYETERRPHTRHMILLAITVGTLMTRGGRVGDLLRRLVAPRLHRVPGIRDKVLDSATPALHRGRFVLRRRWRPSLPGSLCPNLPVDGERRFDDVAGGRFALVACAPVVEQDRREARARGAVVVDVRPGEPLHEWLTRGRARAAIVRPDGTVLVASKWSSEAVAHLPSLHPVREVQA
jgi:3-(3-hydroxy-phenyl)propionate hydroxylase